MASRLRQPQSVTDKNAAILKELLKRPENKICADCHVTTHPRWASWSLGVFICIRCSGIHRGMGTHISRVKSADLDAWTDEQTANMVKWGNRRANKYWEAKLPSSHIPSDSKMENFIRTKYSSRRWVLTPQIPEDPSVLDDLPEETEGSDAEVPLAVVKRNLERTPPKPRVKQVQQTSANLLGQDTPPKSRTPDLPSLRTDSPPPMPRVVSNAALLGIEFDSPVRTQSAPPPISSSPTVIGGKTNVATSRNDLKNSILKLYAPKPAPAAAPVVSSPPLTSSSPPSSSMSAFSDLSSLSMSAPATKPATTNSLGDLTSALGGLSIPSTTSSSTSSQQPPSSTAPSGLRSSPFSFGQTAAKPPASSPQLSTPSTFTIPLPSAPTKSTITSTFNLSNSNSQAKSIPPPSAPPKQSGIQLLSSFTPTTTSTTATSIMTNARSSAPSVTSNYANPWAAPNSTTAPTLNPLRNPWSSDQKESTTTSTPQPSKPNPTSFGGLGFGGESSNSLWDSKSTNGRQGFNSFSSANNASGNEWGKSNSGTSKEEKKNLDDGFGLFQTSEVWK